MLYRVIMSKKVKKGDIKSSIKEKLSKNQLYVKAVSSNEDAKSVIALVDNFASTFDEIFTKIAEDDEAIKSLQEGIKNLNKLIIFVNGKWTK